MISPFSRHHKTRPSAERPSQRSCCANGSLLLRVQYALEALGALALPRPRRPQEDSQSYPMPVPTACASTISTATWATRHRAVGNLRPSLPSSIFGTHHAHQQPAPVRDSRLPRWVTGPPAAVSPSTRYNLRPSAPHHQTHCRTRPSHAGPHPLCWAAAHHLDPPPEPPAPSTSPRASQFALCAPPEPCESMA